MKELKAYYLSEDFFDEILEVYKDRVVTVEDFSLYTYGGNFKSSVIYDGVKKIVITESKLFYKEPEKVTTEWMQCICYRKHKQKESIQVGITGGIAWKRMKALVLKSGYSEEEFNKCMNSHKRYYNPNYAQIHFEWQREPGVVYKYSNAVKYDMNGSYANALITIFPKAKNKILKLYNERKEHPENKELINYFVGMFCRKGYSDTFNWVVQTVRKEMEFIIDKVGGKLIYANTDGFAVCNAENILTDSKELGGFKCEYSGDIFTYSGENYWIMQAGDNITGNLLYQVRNDVDLRVGKVVKYDRIRKGMVFLADNAAILQRSIING